MHHSIINSMTRQILHLKQRDIDQALKEHQKEQRLWGQTSSISIDQYKEIDLLTKERQELMDLNLSIHLQTQQLLSKHNRGPYGKRGTQKLPQSSNIIISRC